jgi:phage terminase large subunit
MEITATAELEKCVQMAKDAGAPADQVERFLSIGYVPLSRMWNFHAAARLCDQSEGPEEIGMGGSRGPGKSHASILQVVDDLSRRDGLKFLFLRKVQKAAKESFEDLIGRALRFVPHEYAPSTRKLSLPNGSRCIFGGFRDESDIDAYLGIEYDGMVIEESNTLTERKHEMLHGSLRTSRDDWRPRIYHTFNPGAIGHAYIKKKFVLPYRTGREDLTRFIPSTFRDNPFLNPEYKRWLENLSGPLGKAWRDGDFDVFEGQAFITFSYDAHVVEPFEIPGHWARYRGVDWGYAAPFACLWGAKDPDSGRIVVYRELYVNPGEGDTPLNDRQQARRIVEMTPAEERILASYMDPSMWASKTSGEQVTTTADIYAQNDLYGTKANNHRLDGKRRIDRLLGNLPDGRPGLLIFRNCRNLIRTLPELVFDDTHVEDVDTQQEDHAYDALRYLTSPATDAKPASRTPNQPAPIKRMFRR